LHFHESLSHFGVYPREVFGLKGILFSPFLHGDLEHLANNSIALFVLLPILRYFYKEQSFVVLFLNFFSTKVKNKGYFGDAEN
jgi:membrane associated rhomboid family serine protease